MFKEKIFGEKNDISVVLQRSSMLCSPLRQQVPNEGRRLSWLGAGMGSSGIANWARWAIPPKASLPLEELEKTTLYGFSLYQRVIFFQWYGQIFWISRNGRLLLKFCTLACRCKDNHLWEKTTARRYFRLSSKIRMHPAVTISTLVNCIRCESFSKFTQIWQIPIL